MTIDQTILFKAIVDNIAEGLYIVDKDLKIVFINPQAKKIMDIAESDLSMIGMSCHDFSKGKWCNNTASICETLRTGNEFHNVEIKIKDEHGKCKVLRQTTRRLEDKKGTIVGAMAIMSDVSEIACLKSHLQVADSFQNIVGKNYQMLDLYDSIKQVAKTDATVLILGESGTGKELVVDAIHQLSKRKDGPLIKVNCSALSENILESELFGHVKGSFTGAVRDKIGKFELAHNGTIFLDEIGELNPKIQIKLLRVLQEKEIEKVGGTRIIKTNVRIIAATNADLKEKIKAGQLRDDLYYRLNVYPVKMPPLSARLDDIELLSRHFLSKFAQLNERPGIELSQSVIALFKRYSWPGNVRELEHAIEYAVIRAKKNVIEQSDLPPDVKEIADTIVPPGVLDSERSFDMDEKNLREALIDCGWNKSKAAQKLKIGRTTLWRFMKQYNIKDPSKN